MKITINFPQPVEVVYSDAAFYEMFDEYFENPHFSESFVGQLIEAAPHYIKVSDWHALAEMPALMPDDIVLACQKEIMKRLIEKYQ